MNFPFVPLICPALPAMFGPAAVAARVAAAPGVAAAEASAAPEALRRMPATAGVESTPTSPAETPLRAPAAEQIQST